VAWLKPLSSFERDEDGLLARLWLGLFALSSALLLASLILPIKPWNLVAVIGVPFLSASA